MIGAIICWLIAGAAFFYDIYLVMAYIDVEMPIRMRNKLIARGLAAMFISLVFLVFAVMFTIDGIEPIESSSQTETMTEEG